jgi:hypothetical protein
MKKILFFIILGILFLNNTVFCANKDIPDKFFSVLSQIESNNKPNTIGDNGLAIGIYQIHEIYFKDALQYDESLRKYKYSDCFNSGIAKLIVRAYMSKYAKDFSFEEMARLHNGGPNFRNKINKTNKYWERFQKELNRNK